MVVVFRCVIVIDVVNKKKCGLAQKLLLVFLCKTLKKCVIICSLMANIRRIVLDVLKPYEPSLIAITERISDLKTVSSVNATLYEVDKKVETIKMTIVGSNLSYEEIEQKIAELGGSVHSVDEVVAGEELIDEVKTPQDG